jgi:hypothetical protein
MKRKKPISCQKNDEGVMLKMWWHSLKLILGNNEICLDYCVLSNEK